jgi:exonuclease SbcD
VCCDFLAHVRSGHGATETEREAVAAAVEAARLRRAAKDGEGAVRGEGGPAERSVPGQRHEGVA